jgi:ABC-type proline/glycine betaine transport system permease subunit
MTYITKHWNGEFSLAKAFWLSWILMSLFIKIPLILIGNYITASSLGVSFWEMISQNNAWNFLHVGPLYLSEIYMLIDGVLYTWWSVGTWKSCKKSSHGFWKFMVKALILLGWAMLFFSIIKIVIVNS